MRSTKIIATIGPVSNNVEILEAMVLAGMDAARFNFSHGSLESHLEMVEKVKWVREKLNRPIPLILDTKGPEIRTGPVENDQSIFLKAGENFTLSTEAIMGNQKKVQVLYKDLLKDTYVGAKILIDDGQIELLVKQIKDSELLCEVIDGGVLRSHKGVNLPSMAVNLPAMTDKDKQDILFGIKHGYEFIAASFVKHEDDVGAVRKFLAENGGENIRIISKIENRSGLNNIEKIIDASDGVMVARGDLGVEILPEEVPMAQKRIIAAANISGKLVITATQMLESMTHSPRPTRAEASDVANAVYDGSDAIMLSGETAMGKYPVESIKIMGKIAQQVETDDKYYTKGFRMSQNYNFKKHKYDPIGMTNSISYATCLTAEEVGAKCIIALTTSGFTARNIAKFKPYCPIVAITAEEIFYRQLSLAWGCEPVLYDFFNEIDVTNVNEIFEVGETMARRVVDIEDGDIILMVAGLPIGLAGTTNMMRLHVCGGDDKLSKNILMMDK